MDGFEVLSPNSKKNRWSNLQEALNSMNHISADHERRLTLKIEESVTEAQKTRSRSSESRNGMMGRSTQKSLKTPQEIAFFRSFENSSPNRIRWFSRTNSERMMGWFSMDTNINASTIRRRIQTEKEPTSTVLKTSGALQNRDSLSSTGSHERRSIFT